MSLLPTDPKERRYLFLSLKIATDFGVSLAAPVIIFVLIGQWLDGKYDSNYRYTALSLILAALVSGKIIFNKARAYGKEYQDIEKQNTKNLE